MLRVLLAACAASALFCHAQADAPQRPSEPSLAEKLAFEATPEEGAPGGWGGGPGGTLFSDEKTIHAGKRSARIERKISSPGRFSTLTTSIPIDFTGATVELRGFLKTADVSGFAALWMRQDGDAGPVAFENMQQRGVKGTTDWTAYSISLPLHKEAKQLFFGVLVNGTGTAWADELRLLVDGKPVKQAAK